MAVLPIFGWRAVPVVARTGITLMITVFFAITSPPTINSAAVGWLGAVVMMLQEAVIGLALGLTVRLLYSSVQQGGMIAAQQMGFADAGVIDPLSGTPSRPIAAFFEMIFALLFLGAGGHRLLLVMIGRSFEGFPVGEAPDLAILAAAVLKSGSMMLVFALKMAAPMLAGFLILAVLLCILARVLPEMNLLMLSFPLRVGVGLVMATAIMPSMDAFTRELARWMNKYLIT